MKITSIPLINLVPDPTQPRSAMPAAELDTLAASIRDRGLLNPIRVKPADENKHHTIVSGHRRHAALVRLGAETAACVITATSSDEVDILAEQLAENIHRENLSPIEEAAAYCRYLALKDITAAQAAAELNVPPTRISRALPLLDLPQGLRDAVHAGHVPKETAYHLSRLPEGNDRDQLFARALSGTLSRDKAARAAKAATARRPSAETSVRRVNCQLAAGRSVTVSGAAIDLDALIDTLEEVLREARKARTQNWNVSTLAKVFKDRSAVGGTV
ncbi:ParB/RepB/Spo0J family partition protein [Frigoriglobus tundricola]|uniref:ParB-like N-terminal domain-containing protein n=1 Tax=Frigoriglobus tundricola TaxID=2774151 RepID=A0A6M5YYC9_9BACT|nr:ParB/RepB/Spo0J family partition protein [Frigoriglobus tundricola]QJW98436.1 hypothetical protein FTUN_6026 [Frigoriglobus tundricola]